MGIIIAIIAVIVWISAVVYVARGVAEVDEMNRGISNAIVAMGRRGTRTAPRIYRHSVNSRRAVH